MWCYGDFKHFPPYLLGVIALTITPVHAIAENGVTTFPVAKPVIPPPGVKELLRHPPNVLPHQVKLLLRQGQYSLGRFVQGV